MFDKLWTLFGRGKAAEADAAPSGDRTCQASPHSRASGEKARGSGRSRISERGNVFFTLFGAVAVVGVLGAGIMSTMRGPLTTMVEVNRIEETKAELRLAARMILLKSKDNNATGEVSATEGAPGTNQYTEALEPAAPTSIMTPGMGVIPGSSGAKQKDAWGTTIGYCAWNNGPDNTARGRWLAGSNDQNAVALALISAGPDRKFQTSCEGADTFVNQSILGDDIVVQLDYSQAVSGSGGLWSAVQMKDDDGNDIEGAEINRALSVTSSGTSQFQGGAAFGESIRTEGQIQTDMISPFPGASPLDYIEFTGSVLLPSVSGLSCGANEGAIAYDGAEDIVAFCDGSSWQPLGKKFWIEDTNGIRNNATLAPHVGIGADSSSSFGLAVGGGTQTDTLNATGDVDFDAKLDVAGATSLADILEVAGATVLGSTLDVTGNAELDGTLGVDGESEFRDDVTVISDVFINKTVTGGGTLTVEDSITAEEGDITATAGNVVATAGNVEATAGNVTAGDSMTAENNITATNGDIAATAGNVTAGNSITAQNNITATSGDIEAIDGKIIGNSFHRGNGSAPDFSDIDSCDVATEKLVWSSSGWSCQPDLGAGTGTGGAQTLAEVLANGNDADGKDAEDFDQIGANEYCTANLSSCVTSQALIEGSQIWKRNTGDTSKVYYNDGNVGIGTDNPVNMLDVLGNVGISGGIAVGGGAVFDTNTLVVDATGNRVGILNALPQTALDVAGTIRMGTGNENCDAGRLGAVRYDASGNKFEVCADESKGWEDLFKSGDKGGIWAANDAGKPYIEYDDSPGGDMPGFGMRVGRVTGSNVIVEGWTIDAPNSMIFTNGKVGANEYCAPDGTSCFDPAVLSGMGDSMFWKNNGPGGTSKIFYNAGNVGIGTNNPLAQFEIVSATGSAHAQLAAPAGQSSILGLKAKKAWAIQSLGEIGTAEGHGQLRIFHEGLVPYFVIQESGLVGINKTLPKTALDVGGTLRIGDGTELCNVTDHEGAIKYDAATDEFYVCRNNATGWEPIGSGSGLPNCSVAGDVARWNGSAWICSPVGAGGEGELDIVIKTATTASTANQNVVVDCPAGYKVTGGGIDNVAWNSSLVQSFPGDEDSWTCSAKHGYGTSQTMTCYAICAKGSVAGGGGGSSIAVYATESANDQAIPMGAWQKILYKDEIYDTANAYNPVTGVFTAPQDGYYFVDGSWYGALDANNYGYIAVFKNNAVLKGTLGRSGTTQSGRTQQISTVVQLAANDTLHFSAYVQGGTSILSSGATYNNMSITYLGGASGSGGGGDTLAGLSCVSGQVAQWNGTAWACADVGSGGGGSAVAFTATQGSAQSIANGAWTDLAFGTQLQESGGDNFSTSTGKFTAPVAGYYQFSANVGYATNPLTGTFTIMVQKNDAGVNGQQVCYATDNGGTAGSGRTVSCSGTIYLTAGEVIEALAYQSSGSAQNTGPTRTQFSGFLIGGGSGGSDTLAGLSCMSGQVAAWNGTAWACTDMGSGGSGSTGPAFSVHKNGTNQTVTTGTPVLLTFPTEAFDTNNNFASNRFTPTVAGKYQINGAVHCHGGGDCIVSINKNGTAIAAGVDNRAAHSYAQTSTLVDMNGTTDYLELYVNSAVTTINGSAANTFFNGFMVGGSGSGSGGDSLWSDSGNGYIEYSVVDAGVKLQNVTGMPQPALGLATGMTWMEGTNTLAITGNITYTGTITDTSDRRLKTDIEDLVKYGSMLDKINAIDTYSFRMKNNPEAAKEFGVMAQELEAIFPELVKTADDEMGTKSVNYIGLIAPVIEATKELSAENKALKAEVESLRAERQAVKADVESLKEQVALLSKLAADDAEKASAYTMWLALLAAMGITGALGLVIVRRRKA